MKEKCKAGGVMSLLKTIQQAPVEWKELGEVGKVSMCKRILKNQTSEVGDVPFYKIGTFGKEPTAYISRELFEDYKEKYSYPKVGDILISASGTIGRTVVFNGEESYFQDSNIVWLEHDESQVLNRYLFYFYQMNPWQVSSGGTISRLYNGNIEKTKIPIPPLEIQEEIVQILDKFTEYVTELTAELTDRKKQYSFYRDKLLSFSDEVYQVEWKTLGEVCEFTRGNGLQKKDFVDEGFPVIHYGQIYTRYGFSTKETYSYTDKVIFDKLKKAQPNDIVMATTSENVEDVGKALVWEGDTEIGVSGDAYIIQTSQNPRYINYFFKSQHFQRQKEKKVSGTKVIRINAKDMKTFKIPIPSLVIQERIVHVLDNFDTVCNDLKIGLPKEIELRQKQYEFYREKLLTFDEKSGKPRLAETSRD